MALRLLTTLILAGLVGCGAPGNTSATGNGYAIYGTVARPGAHGLGDGDLTLLEAVLAARPIPGQADLTRVMVMREVQGDSFARTIDLIPLLESGGLIESGEPGDAGANLRLRHGDIVIVPPRDG